MSELIAFLDSNNVVTQIVQSPDDGQDWAAIWGQKHDCDCIVTAKDGSIRNKYAQPGDSYYADIDAFLEPKPYESWVLNESEKKWQAPVEMPDDEDLIFAWDESKENWVIIYDVAINGPMDCIDC